MATGLIIHPTGGKWALSEYDTETEQHQELLMAVQMEDLIDRAQHLQHMEQYDTELIIDLTDEDNITIEEVDQE